MAQLSVKEPKFCHLCGNVCITTGERTLRLCYSCGKRAESKKVSYQRKPGYGFRHV